MNRFLKLMIGTWISLSNGICFAYSISNHELISQRAVQEFNVCWRIHSLGQVSDEEKAIIVKSNLSEDYNIITKTLRWHFYNPNKSLKHWVYNSFGISRSIAPYFSKRVRQAKVELISYQKNRSYAFVGNLIHFLQDMTCPPHVVPIFHTTSDAFDNYPLVSVYSPKRPETINCSYIKSILNLHSPEDPLTLIQNQFYKTSTRIKSPILDKDGNRAVTQNGSPIEATWEMFWAGLESPDFGHYGEFGNEFGSSNFTIPGSNGIWNWMYSFVNYTHYDFYSLDSSYYSNFAQRQHRDAIDLTIQAIYWLKKVYKTPQLRENLQRELSNHSS